MKKSKSEIISWHFCKWVCCVLIASFRQLYQAYDIFVYATRFYMVSLGKMSFSEPMLLISRIRNDEIFRGLDLSAWFQVFTSRYIDIDSFWKLQNRALFISKKQSDEKLYFQIILCNFSSDCFFLINSALFSNFVSSTWVLIMIF